MVTDGTRNEKTEGPMRPHTRGSLVSRRIEMYESPNNKKTFTSREKFFQKSPQPPVESREDTSHTRGEDIHDESIQSGVKLYKEGEYQMACDTFEAALLANSRDNDTLPVATILGNLGPVYLKLGQLDKAEECLKTSIEMKRRLDSSICVADMLSNLGTCANLKGDYQGSLDYYREALQELRLKSGSRKDMANALFNLGRLLVQKAEWDTAMGVLRESVRVQREVYGENHIYVAQTLELVGFAQLSTEAHDSALLSFTGALAVYRRVNGPLHKTVANVLFNVGLAREKKMELADAWEAYATCRDLYRRLETPRDDPGYRVVRASISKVERAILKQNQASQTDTQHATKATTQDSKSRRSKRQVAI